MTSACVRWADRELTAPLQYGFREFICPACLAGGSAMKVHSTFLTKCEICWRLFELVSRRRLKKDASQNELPQASKRFDLGS